MANLWKGGGEPSPSLSADRCFQTWMRFLFIHELCNSFTKDGYTTVAKENMLEEFFSADQVDMFVRGWIKKKWNDEKHVWSFDNANEKTTIGDYFCEYVREMVFTGNNKGILFHC